MHTGSNASEGPLTCTQDQIVEKYLCQFSKVELRNSNFGGLESPPGAKCALEASFIAPSRLSQVGKRQCPGNIGSGTSILNVAICIIWKYMEGQALGAYYIHIIVEMDCCSYM